MAELGHGDKKYKGQRLGELSVLPDIRIERRRIEQGVHPPLTLECNEVVITLAGRSVVNRTGDGDSQQTLAQPGTTWICPVGTYEQDLELSEPLECLHVYL